MKRLTVNEKKQLGTIIHYYRNLLYKSNLENKDQYKQVHFSKGICSQAQLSRLENGEALKNNDVYGQLLEKLNLRFERLKSTDSNVFDQLFKDVLKYQNNDNLLINTHQYFGIIDNYYHIFRHNIIYTHYNYALELIITILSDELSEAEKLLELVLETIDILPPTYLVITLHYIGIFYIKCYQYETANKYLLLAIENMTHYNITNGLIYIDYASSLIRTRDYLIAHDFLNKAQDEFYDSNNFLLQLRIYRYYSIIYLIRGYYDETMKNLQIAFKLWEYSKQNKNDDQQKLYLIEACLLYIHHKKQEAIEVLEQMNDDYMDESKELLKTIILRKKSVSQSACVQSIGEFYAATNKEDLFEEMIIPLLTQLPISIAYVIVNDYFQYLKDRNKYKKALELSEKFRI